jgi:hypothetical protein
MERGDRGQHVLYITPKGKRAAGVKSSLVKRVRQLSIKKLAARKGAAEALLMLDTHIKEFNIGADEKRRLRDAWQALRGGNRARCAQMIRVYMGGHNLGSREKTSLREILKQIGFGPGKFTTDLNLPSSRSLEAEIRRRLPTTLDIKRLVGGWRIIVPMGGKADNVYVIKQAVQGAYGKLMVPKGYDIDQSSLRVKRTATGRSGGQETSRWEAAFNLSKTKSVKKSPEQEAYDDFATKIRQILRRGGSAFDSTAKRELLRAASYLESGDVDKAYSILKGAVASDQLPAPYHRMIRQIVYDL